MDYVYMINFKSPYMMDWLFGCVLLFIWLVCLFLQCNLIPQLLEGSSSHFSLSLLEIIPLVASDGVVTRLSTQSLLHSPLPHFMESMLYTTGGVAVKFNPNTHTLWEHLKHQRMSLCLYIGGADLAGLSKSDTQANI